MPPATQATCHCLTILATTTPTSTLAKPRDRWLGEARHCRQSRYGLEKGSCEVRRSTAPMAEMRSVSGNRWGPAYTTKRWSRSRSARATCIDLVTVGWAVRLISKPRILPSISKRRSSSAPPWVDQ